MVKKNCVQFKMFSLLHSYTHLYSVSCLFMSVQYSHCHAGNTFFSQSSFQPQICGTSNPDEDLISRHRWLADNEPRDNILWNRTTVQNRVVATGNSKRQSPSVITIQTYMHVIADVTAANTSSTRYVHDQNLYDQLNVLNKDYNPYGIRYILAGITRTTNDSWAANQDDLAMKRRLRTGSYSALNIYFQTRLQATKNTPGNSPIGTILLGYCALPVSGVAASTKKESYIADGCNILSRTLPGQDLPNYNLGGTTVHEVGHWNGLLHTFQDYTCDPTDFGDYVADTPQQSIPTTGCPPDGVKDSCPNSGVSKTAAGQAANPVGPSGFSGADAIHNLMDYSSDVCYQGFSPGQAARMLNIWRLYREGR